jgi:GNAT superfamily N-acetyltransferase
MVDISDLATFEHIPPCADLRFDHRTCDYWEDAERGSKLARPTWLTATPPLPTARPSLEGNPFAPPAGGGVENPFAPRGRAVDLGLLLDDDAIGVPEANPFAPTQRRERPLRDGVPRKLALLDRGRGVFGSYAKVAFLDERAVAYAQFGPLSAYPRAIRLRDLYPQLPQAPLPAVITCTATTREGRRHGYARALVLEVCRDLAGRGFAAVEAYPDLTRPEDDTSAGRPGFWAQCGFTVAVSDERFPVMRRELD